MHRFIHFHKLPSRSFVPWRVAARFSFHLPSDENLPVLDYQPIEDVERVERYRPGGYCPRLIGDILRDRYQIVHKLGHGTFSMVWLTHDRQQAAYVAVKVGTADSPSREGDVLRAITNSTKADFPVPSYGTAPVWLGKPAKDISLGDARIFLSDYGGAFLPTDPTQIRTGEECCSALPGLPPEAYFRPDKPISFASDIWTLACAIWSIFSSRPLFDATLATHDDISSQQADILGSLTIGVVG
ncbi:hypothetical protein BJY01DRAFT_255161 [Aspergillus pseudoustus]|uniref:non-specific serine/threonine protein kinase n=1 Tax=Aspergillus pseudoustus TaxID=1810923 RepID=A0ABR4IMT9_9EURO